MTERIASPSKAQIEAIAGFSAGTISTLIFHPMDIVKTRLQVFRCTSSAPVTIHAVVQGLISRKNPIRSIYRGLTPNLLGNAGSWSIFLGLKSIIEDQIIRFHNSESSGLLKSSKAVSKSQGLLTPFEYFLASGISGMIITLSTNPIWVLKTRMLSSDRGKDGAYENMWKGSKQILKREGLRGFYKGAGISLLSNSHGAVQFSVYEPIKIFWIKYVARHRDTNQRGQKEERLGTVATLTISGCAKVTAGTVTYPLQVLRSRLQVSDLQHANKYDVYKVIRILWREQGFKGFYKGLSINIIRVLPATWTTFLVYENVKYFLPIFA